VKAALVVTDADLRGSAQAVIQLKAPFLHPKLNHALKRAGLYVQFFAQSAQSYRPVGRLYFVKDSVKHEKKWKMEIVAD